MENKLYFIMSISLLIFIISLILILVISKNRKILSFLYRINESEKSIIENLKNKLDLTIRIINIIERELKIESKTFEQVKKLRSEKSTNFIIDEVLKDAGKEIIEICEDYKELSKIKSFDGIISDIKELDIYITGSIKYYNKYTLLYNNLIKKFPNNVISNIKKYQIKTLFMEKENIEDLNFN